MPPTCLTVNKSPRKSVRRFGGEPIFFTRQAATAQQSGFLPTILLALSITCSERSGEATRLGAPSANRSGHGSWELRHHPHRSKVSVCRRAKGAHWPRTGSRTVGRGQDEAKDCRGCDRGYRRNRVHRLVRYGLGDRRRLVVESMGPMGPMGSRPISTRTLSLPTARPWRTSTWTLARARSPLGGGTWGLGRGLSMTFGWRWIISKGRYARITCDSATSGEVPHAGPGEQAIGVPESSLGESDYRHWSNRARGPGSTPMRGLCSHPHCTESIR